MYVTWLGSRDVGGLKSCAVKCEVTDDVGERQGSKGGYNSRCAWRGISLIDG
jgi:hypothetical protein